MRARQFFLATLKEAPAEAELISHRLMLRAGLIKKLGAGLYTWMPLGLRVLRKIEAIVRQEMNAAGALELLMPAVQPAELWQETGRWAVFGPQMLKIKDRHERDFCFGPTHEEVITDVARSEIKSYKQLPLNFYQIQTKFRDEIRPRFGVMRAREFVMKDAYSFHTDVSSLQATYAVMHRTYSTIFNRLGLKFRAVAADTGAIGGDGSHEFHVLADAGEDLLAYCPSSDYAANVELAHALPPGHQRLPAQAHLQQVPTPGVTTIAQVVACLPVAVTQTVKAVVVDGVDGQPVLLLVRGDHTLNEIKAEKLPQVKTPLSFASPETILQAFGCLPGSLGPVGFKGLVIADHTVAAMSDMVCGANMPDVHLTGVNWGRDCPEPLTADIRNVVAGDPSPDGQGELALCRGIEVGHIFQLRTKYASAMNCTYLDANGKTQVMEMGCYGIGVSRIVGACIEQNHDERGIIFPLAMAPFSVVIVPLGMKRSEAVRTVAEALYAQLQAAGIDVLLDDRDERPGVLLADAELMGIPYRVVIGERGLQEGHVEWQGRRDSEAQKIAVADIAAQVQQQLAVVA